MPTTPVRAGTTTASFATFPEQLLGRNIRSQRQALALSQRHLAWRMSAAGNDWFQATVSAVELGARGVTSGELLSLAIALEEPLLRLLDARPDGAVAVELGGRLVPMSFMEELLGGGDRLPVRWSEQGWEPRRRGNRHAAALDRRLRGLADPGIDVSPVLQLVAALELGAERDDVQALGQRVAALREQTPAGEWRALLDELLALAGETGEC